MIPAIISKLPSEIRLQVARATKKESSEVWEIEELFNLIQKEMEGRETTEQVRATTDLIKHMGNFSNTPKRVNQATASTLFTRPKETGNGKVFNSYIQCVYCGQAHYSASCEHVKVITERKNILLRHRRFLGALKLAIAKKIVEYVATAAIMARVEKPRVDRYVHFSGPIFVYEIH